MKRWLVVVVCTCSAAAWAQRAGGKIVDVWDEPAMTKEALLQFLPRDLDVEFRAMEPAKARQLKSELAAVERQVPDPVDRVSYGTHLSGLLEGLGFTGVARIYADWAVLQNPDSRVAIANVGAISCFPPILRLAIALDPKNPVPQTNLGSCAMSAQKWEPAKTAYEKAVALDSKHKPALIGLGQWYLRVRDLRSAIDYFVRANGYAIAALKDEKGKPVPPTRPVEPTGNRKGGGPAQADPRGGGDEGGASHVTKNKLELPPLPGWTTPDAFIVSGKARKKLASFYGEKMSKGLKLAAEMAQSNPLAKLNAELKRIESLPPEERDAAGVEAALKPHWDDAEVSRALAFNYAWAGDQLRKAEEDFKAVSKQYKKLGNAIEDVGHARNKKLEAMCPPGKGSLAAAAKCFEGARAELVTSCKESMSLSGKLFAVYRDGYARWYDAVRPVLEELYRVQGLWLRQLGDQRQWEIAVMARDTFVFGPLAMKMTEEDLMRLTLAGFGVASFGLSAEVCPKEPVAPLEPEAPPTIPQTDNPTQDCPLPKDGLKIPPVSIPGVPFSFTVWCKEAELKLTAGLGEKTSKNQQVKLGAAAVLSVKHRFGTDKSTTVSIGVEAGLTAKTAAGSETGVKLEGGTSVTFTRTGQLEGVDASGGASVSLDLPGVAKGSGGVTAAIEKGSPSVDVGAAATLPF